MEALTRWCWSICPHFVLRICHVSSFFVWAAGRDWTFHIPYKCCYWTCFSRLLWAPGMRLLWYRILLNMSFLMFLGLQWPMCWLVMTSFYPCSRWAVSLLRHFMQCWTCVVLSEDLCNYPSSTFSTLLCVLLYEFQSLTSPGGRAHGIGIVSLNLETLWQKQLR